MPRLTVAILTLNEEKRIANCIRSAAFADEIIVVDSGSRDRTVEIARELGASVHDYPDWQGFAVQRNRLLAHATGDFIFFLDADEEFTPALVAEVQQAVQAGAPGAWEICWEQVAFGRRLSRMRESGGVLRLFPRHELLRFEGVVHEHAVLASGQLPVRRFKARLLHHSRETVHGSLLKLAQYAQLGAVKRAERGQTGGIVRGFLSGSVLFVRLYVFRGGFLCGPQGFLHCFLIGLECFFRYVALRYDRDSLTHIARRG